MLSKELYIPIVLGFNMSKKTTLLTEEVLRIIRICFGHPSSGQFLPLLLSLVLTYDSIIPSSDVFKMLTDIQNNGQTNGENIKILFVLCLIKVIVKEKTFGIPKTKRHKIIRMRLVSVSFAVR